MTRNTSRPGENLLIVDRVTEADLDALALLLEELSGDPTNRKRMIRELRAILDDHSYILLGARLDGVLAGTAMGILCRDLIGDCRPFMVVENVIVSASVRGSGVGTALMNALEREADARGCLYINIVSSMHRAGAHRFYESLGYPADAARGFRKYLREDR